jgi:hypothetical protein
MPNDNQAPTVIEPEAAGDIREFVEQFDDDRVFGVTFTSGNGKHSRYVVAASIERVRPSAVPIDQAATYDITTLDEEGVLDKELRLTVEDIADVRVAERPSV